jgi:predicted nucleotidyltransferase
VLAVVLDKRAHLAELCRRFDVARLELFGSAANGRFDAQDSDLDFLVEFRPGPVHGASDRYFGLLEALQDLFRRPVDLLDATAIRNPYLMRSIEASRQLLYAA